MILGLTGGIASGKSTVANMFRSRGYTVLDSDIFARDVVMPHKPAWYAIRETFGDEYLLPDGNINRRLLGTTVFADNAARERLNQIIHPRVIELIEQGIEASERKGEALVVVDVPLLFEIGYDKEVDVTVVVDVRPEVQISRLQARDGLTAREAQSRINAQLPLSTKVEQAHYVIDNSGTLEETAQQVAKLLEDLLYPETEDRGPKF
ncbi:MAG: dephospho-CoA kinase [Firmicutes bacterium]|nr:dephospho-CoA kinase [Bacillota bacterium]